MAQLRPEAGTQAAGGALAGFATLRNDPAAQAASAGEVVVSDGEAVDGPAPGRDSRVAVASDRRPSGRLRDALVWLGIASLPALLLIAVFAWGNIFPFGGFSNLSEDLGYQYVDFFLWFKRVLAGEARLGYSSSLSLGLGSWGIFSYYLSSPFNLIIALFDEEHITSALFLIALGKLMLIQFSAAWCLGRRFGLPRWQLAVLALAYSFSSWVVTNVNNPLWLDALYLMPWAMLGSWRYLREGGIHRVALPVAATIITCWYMGYMVSLFLCLYVLLETWCLHVDEPELLRGRLVRRAGGYAGALVLAVGVSAWTFVPTVLVMSGTALTPTDFSPYLVMGARSQIATGFLAGAYDPYSTPQLFCGGLVPLLALRYLLNREVALRKRLAGLALLFFLLASVCVSTLYFVWCGLRAPNGFYCRISFLCVTLLVWLAAGELTQLRTRSLAVHDLALPVGIVLAVQAYAILVGAFGSPLYALVSCASTLTATAVIWFACQRWGSEGGIDAGANSTGEEGSRTGLSDPAAAPGEEGDHVGLPDAAASLGDAATGAGLAVGTPIVVASPAARPWRIVLVAFCVLELLWGGHLSLVQNGCYVEAFHDWQTGYLDASARQLAALKELDPGFWRMDKTYTRSRLAALDEGMGQGYAQLSSYASSFNLAAVQLLQALGYSRPGEFSVRYGAPLITSDTVFGVRYAFPNKESGDGVFYEQVDLQPAMKGVDVQRNPLLRNPVLRNPYALSLGYLVDDDALSFSFDPRAERPFELQDSLFSALVGRELQVFEPLEPTVVKDEGTRRELRVEAADDQAVFLYLENRAAEIEVDDKAPYLSGDRFSHYVYPAGLGSHDVVIRFDGPSDDPALHDVELQACTLDLAAFEEVAHELAEHQLELEEYSEGHIAGTVEADADGWLMLSVPHEAGWSATVDGSGVDIADALGGACMAIPVHAGTNHVVLDFQVRGLVPGIAITLASGAILACLWLRYRRS